MHQGPAQPRLRPFTEPEVQSHAKLPSVNWAYKSPGAIRVRRRYCPAPPRDYARGSDSQILRGLSSRRRPGFSLRRHVLLRGSLCLLVYIWGPTGAISLLVAVPCGLGDDCDDYTHGLTADANTASHRTGAREQLDRKSRLRMITGRSSPPKAPRKAKYL